MSLAATSSVNFDIVKATGDKVTGWEVIPYLFCPPGIYFYLDF